MNNDKVMVARMLNLDYLNSFDQNQLDLSENDVTKNINNLVVTMEDNKVHLKWNDCVNQAWKKSYIVKAENSIPTSVYNGNIIASYTEKNQYSTIDLIDDEINDNVLYCYRVFSEFENEAKYYSGFKNIFYVYVTSVTVCDENHESGPVLAKDIVTDPLHKFVSEQQIALWTNKSNFNGDYESLTNKPQLSTVATSGEYTDLNNIPELSDVATSGDYNDLDNIPDVYIKSEVYSREETYSKDEIGNLIKSTTSFTGNYEDLQNKPKLAKIATSGKYEDLIDAPELSEVATSGRYTDLTDTPDVYSKSEVYSKEQTYSQQQVNDLINTIKNNAPANVSGVYKYVPQGANNNDCYVVATKPGITFTKTGNRAELTVPDDTVILSIQVRFTGSEVGTSGKVVIKYGDNYNFTDNMFIPTYSVLQDTQSNRVYRLGQAATFETMPNEIQLVGLNSNIGVVAKLTF